MTDNVKKFEKELEAKVLVKSVSSKGHDERVGTPQESLNLIKEQTENHGKWAYVDGRQVNPGVLTIEDLLEAQNITLTNALVGG